MAKRHRPGRGAARLFAHVEDVLVAATGEDAFEIVFAVAAALLLDRTRRDIAVRIAAVARSHRALDVKAPRRTPGELLERVAGLIAKAVSSAPSELEALDAIFEALVPRVAKSDKGQFFTPRHVVDFVVTALDVRAGERVADPSCGSGAFLSRAWREPRVQGEGVDIDARAVRVARLLACAAGRGPECVTLGDGLRRGDVASFDVIATNPPFAGASPPLGFEVERVVRRPERDALFLERALTLLVPGGRLGIVLPYNKVSADAFAPLRAWLVARARVLAVVALPRETFLPHTAQRTVALFAKKRARPLADGERPDERVWLGVSERSGKASSGEPLALPLAHDLGEVLSELAPFLAREGFSR
ncbi:MAG: N-6 DNA methylase [Polyangiaceae bacterium]